MEIALIILAIVLSGVGIIGGVMPGLPGPFVSWLGYLALYLSPGHEIGNTALLITLAFALLITAMDAYAPIFAAKKFGSTKYGIWGGIIGLLIGIFFFPPFGIILGPFFGTIAGDLIAGSHIKTALNSGVGAVIGFVVGTLIKVAYSTVIIVLIFIEAGEYIYSLF